MAKKIYTQAQIIADLEKQTPGPWVPMNGVHLALRASITGDVIDTGTEGMALKYFLNSRTAEVRPFVAKWIDEPEADTLS